MSNKLKALFICTLAALLIITLASCGLSEEDVAGTYAATYTEDGSTFYVKIILTERGTYGKVTTKDGAPFSSVAGYYAIDDETILLYQSLDKAAYAKYQYDEETLKQNGVVFNQIEEDDNNNEIVMG